MDSDPKSPQVPEKPLAERLVKYLPIFVISHALVTIPTFIISIALAYATFVQADATKKIQMSETWPYVSYGTSNARPDGTNEISFVLQNNGVGPACQGIIATDGLYPQVLRVVYYHGGYPGQPGNILQVTGNCMV